MTGMSSCGLCRAACGFDVAPDVHTDVDTRQPAPLEVEQ